jgi:hypothetical protein
VHTRLQQSSAAPIGIAVERTTAPRAPADAAAVAPHRLDAIEVGPRNVPIQRFPFLAEHRRTQRRMRITSDGESLSATQIAGDPHDMHSGEASYRLNLGSMDLLHIQSDPEEGSGIGSLLVFYLAQIAAQNRCVSIEIPMAAGSATGFYETMGFVPARARAAREREAQMQDDDTHARYAENHAADRARIEYNSDPANRRAGRTWAAVGAAEQANLVRAQEDAFEMLPEGEQRRITGARIHGAAVGMTGGMVGDTAVVRERANAVMQRYWLDDGWVRALDSRHDRAHLTEFPRPASE